MSSGRNIEFFGPDLGRGPFSSYRIETAALQIATALAQLRAPLARSDADLRSHADFIRELADRLAPDWASLITTDVGVETANAIQTSINAGVGTYSLLRCWLADSVGGGETALAPTVVTWNSGVVLQSVTANKHFLVITPSTGIADVTVSYSSARSWYWAISRYGRTYYSTKLNFS